MRAVVNGARREIIVTLDTCRMRTAEQVRAFLYGRGEREVKCVARAAADDLTKLTATCLRARRWSRRKLGPVRQPAAH